MRHLATEDDREPASAPPSRALVATSAPRVDPPGVRRAGRRPDAGFLAQLIVSADPGLRISRIERTRSAAAHYAKAALRRA